jgi:hypothetical protein
MIIPGVVPNFRVSQFVLTCQEHSDGEQQDNARHIADANYDPWNTVARYGIGCRIDKRLAHLPRLVFILPHKWSCGVADAVRD